jgi:hypothetical protein
MTYQSNNFKFGRNPYASKDEWEAAEAAAAAEKAADDEIMAKHAVRWTAKSGQMIEVFVADSMMLLSIDGHDQQEVKFEALPAKQAEAYRAAGIVAKLGPVGVTAERKAAIEARLNSK